ncbi:MULTISPECIES: protein phosphatase 2C domain-containing protein [Bacillaceae]|uniref:protein phosphatase 2C domain-containing protein n=1 Tax=Bacillaceae TaxID=186817 RepID=UPI0029644B9D|nr:protein phosphatase 2C domain-containing protein [Bacillus infantis]MDW2877972.1 protein phosphatase 2C domain-containing protein [Bacillus infantis]
MIDICWTGKDAPYLDDPDVRQESHITIGRFGGNTEAGQYKNEDGCLVWADGNREWEFAIILDAHESAESAELVLQHIQSKKADILEILMLPADAAIPGVEKFILALLASEAFRLECSKVQGETACLFAFRKGQYLWWLSIGDCVLFLFHPELAAMGQHQLNQRQFFEWTGRANAFDLSVPCYTTGRRELRAGINTIFLTTDGLLECPGLPYENPEKIMSALKYASDGQGVKEMLDVIKAHQVRDSTTIISWEASSSSRPLMPGNLSSKG